MGTYFDKYEKREKPIPNCAKVGLAWNMSTGRCEQPTLIDRVAMALQQPLGLGALGDNGDESDYWPPEDEWSDGEECNWWDCSDNGDGGGFGDDPCADGSCGTNPDGTMWWQFEGGLWEESPDGFGWWTDNDTGDSTTYYPGGRWETTFADGSYYAEAPDGSWSWTDAEGNDYWGDSSGNWQGRGTDGTQYSSQSQGGVPAGKTKAEQAKKKATDAANAAKSGGGSSGGSSGGGGGGKQPTAQDLATAGTQAACVAKGGRWNAQANQCLPPSGAKKTIDQQLKENLGFGAGTLAIGLIALFVIPPLIKKL